MSRVEHELPHFVRKKVAKGRTYYYFAMPSDDNERPRHVRLPDINHPLFEKKVSELYRIRKAPAYKKMRAISERRVYFLGADGGPIKIGVSRDPERRCADMQIGSPNDVRVLATAIGGRRLELAYHERFAYLHIRGEWFERHQDILEEIERLQLENGT